MINEDLWAALETLYKDHPKIKSKNGNDREICEAEKILKIHFSDFYRFFLKNHTVTRIGKFSLYSLTSSPSVVEATINYRKDKQCMEHDYYIIAKNDDGSIIGSRSNGDIVILDSDKIFKKKIAENFEEFIQLALQ